MRPSTNLTPSDEDAMVLVRGSEAPGKWRPLIYVEFDGAAPLYLTAEDWVDCGLKAGMRISRAKYVDLERRAQVAMALRDALRLIEARPRFEGELRRALRRKGWEVEQVDEALSCLRRQGLLDDERLVRDQVDAWADQRSRLEIRAKLRSRGAPEDLVLQSLQDQVGDAREKETAVRLAEKYVRQRVRDLSTWDPRRGMAYLVRKGFSPSLAREAVREAVKRFADEAREVEG
ncbi:regulatory protein RecX [Alicyclobacillus vulcanalis]|uniref:Regulatory protein RecX n=1 Tax=Alicyclobacillus vulcanalis TaxID=252246 RepID=A0A1N7MTH7_9BACL|nr:RecX family transcriptional regulator [Alicyclobacillus vulcanalis]SIS89435.1 regulatory protein [Alicyclobacillus vulcanalis]